MRGEDRRGEERRGEAAGWISRRIMNRIILERCAQTRRSGGLHMAASIDAYGSKLCLCFVNSAKIVVACHCLVCKLAVACRLLV